MLSDAILGIFGENSWGVGVQAMGRSLGQGQRCRIRMPLSVMMTTTSSARVPVADWSVGRDLNAVFVAAVEFIDVCHEFPIVFVRTGEAKDGKPAGAGARGFGKSPGKAPAKGAGAGGQPDPMKTAFGYIGADSFSRQRQDQGQRQRRGGRSNGPSGSRGGGRNR